MINTHNKIIDSLELSKMIAPSHQNIKTNIKKLSITPIDIIKEGRGEKFIISEPDAIELLQYYVDSPHLQNGSKDSVYKVLNGLKGIKPKLEIERDKLKEDIVNITNQLKDSNGKIEELNGSYRRLNAYHHNLESDVKLKQEEIDKLKQVIEDKDKSLESFKSDIEQKDLDFKNHLLQQEKTSEELKKTINLLQSNLEEQIKALKVEDINLIDDFRKLKWGNNPINWITNFIKMVVSPIIHLIYRREFMFLVVLSLVFIQGAHLAELFNRSLSDSSTIHWKVMVGVFGILFEVMPIILTVNKGKKIWIYLFAFLAVWTNLCFFLNFGDVANKITVSIALPFAVLSFSDLFFDKQTTL